MEMIDVLKKLEEIATKSPEVAKAIESVKQTNPQDVEENSVQSEKSIAQNDQEVSEEVTDKINEFKVGSYKDFLASKGINIYKLKGDDHVKYAKMYRDAKNQKHQDATAKKGTDDHKTYTPSTANTPAKIEGETNEGGMSDIHIGAQEVVMDYLDDDGNLEMPKAEVLRRMEADAKKVPFPRSYEIETAMDMVRNDFDDGGARKPEIDEPYEDKTDEGNAFAQAVQQAKASGLKKGDKFKVGDEEHTLRDSDFEQVNTNTMENKEKEVVKEAIKISTDSPEEAGMMMQILALAGVKPVDASMMGGDQDQEHDHDGMKHSHPGGDQEHSHDDMRSMMDKIPSDDEKTDEEYANSPDEKTQDTDELLNVQSGGINKQKQQVRKEYPGDNPLAVEDKITEEELANTYRAQYENFKKAYQEAAKPDFLDMDKDGDKKEPMKKAVKDKEEKSK